MGCLNAKMRYGSERVECICTLTEFSPEFCDDKGHCMSHNDKDQRDWCHGYESDAYCPGCNVDLNEEECRCPSHIIWS